jgi:hypothetical protein
MKHFIRFHHPLALQNPLLFGKSIERVLVIDNYLRPDLLSLKWKNR